MCGIVLTYSNKEQTENVSKMLGEISHRGKDQVSIKKHGKCTIGFRRLAINDTNTPQPHEGEWTVYLNGEIYNYKELGDGSECKVISDGLSKYGWSFVRKLNGVFFIVAIKGNDIWLFRDRYGARPVYYYQDDKITIVSSEAKAIYVHPEYRFRVNVNAKRQWMVFNNVFTNETLFGGIYKLPKATFWNLHDKKVWWEWKFTPVDMDWDIAVKTVRELLKRAIKRQKPNIPHAVCVSGGVDSNIIASELPMSSKYTVGYVNYDDERVLARKQNSDLTEVVFSNIVNLRDTIYHLEDLRVGASWANYGLFKRIKEDGCKVCFDGAGADELFGGYTWRYSGDYYDIINRTQSKDYIDIDLPNTLEDRFAFDANHFLEGVLLVGDKMSMAHTIELRVPFLDNDLVDFCLLLPNEFKQDKKILKAAFRGQISDEILDGKKRGFSSPDWFVGEGNKARKWANIAYETWSKIYK